MLDKPIDQCKALCIPTAGVLLVNVRDPLYLKYWMLQHSRM